MFDLFLRRLLNPAAFALRQGVRFRRAGYREGPLDLRRVSPRLREQLESPRVHALATKFGIPTDTLAHAAYTKSLFVCDVLDRLCGERGLKIPGGTVLDVGSKNFEAAPGLHHAAQTLSGTNISLTGVEIDAFPVYRNLHSRADAAQYYLDLLPGTHHYVSGDLRTLDSKFGLITWFFPFVTPSPLLWWGLPERHFAPEENFRHVLAQLASGGTLILTNYTPEESEIQAGLFAKAGLTPQRHAMDELVGRAGQSVYVFVLGP